MSFSAEELETYKQEYELLTAELDDLEKKYAELRTEMSTKDQPVIDIFENIEGKCLKFLRERTVLKYSGNEDAMRMFDAIVEHLKTNLSNQFNDYRNHGNMD